MFKSFTALKFHNTATKNLFSADSLTSAIPEPTIADPEKTSWGSIGFSRPESFGETTVFVGASNVPVFNVQIRERLLPSKVIKEKIREKATEYHKRDGKWPNRKEVAQIKDEVVSSLLPTSHIKPTDVLCAAIGDYLIIGTTSARTTDMVLGLIYGLFDDSKVELETLAFKRKPVEFLTNVLLDEGVGEFLPGSRVTLKSKASVARYKDIEFPMSEIKDHIATGLHVSDLQIVYNERIQFNLTENLLFKGIKFSDVLLTQAREEAGDGGIVELFDSNVALVTAEIKTMLNNLRLELPAEASEDDEL